VNLKTRDFPLRNVLSASVSGGGNIGAAGTDLPKAPTAGREWLGFAGGARRLPAGADPIRTPADVSSLDQPHMNAVIGSFRNVWSARDAAGRGNASLGVSAGGHGLLGAIPLGYLGSFTYATSQDVRRDERRALAVSNGSLGTRPQNAYFGGTGTASVLWGGIFNVTTQLGPGTTLALDNTYSRTADNQATRLAGTSEEFATDLDVTRLTFTERYVRSSQLRAEHHLGQRHTVEWAVSGSSVRRYEPDRSEVIYRAAIDTVRHTSRPLEWWGAPRSAVRTFSDLHESAVEASASYRLAWGPPGHGGALKVGANHRSVDRAEESRPFDLLNLDLSDAERGAAPETIFNGAYAASGRLLLALNSNGGRYTAADRLTAGYAQVELALGERARLIAGARGEDSRLHVRAVTAQGRPSDPAPEYFDLLPALSLTFRLTAAQNLRLSASQTLSRPEYREVSIVPHADNGFEGLIVFGNDSLRRALIRNYDVRWEWYPTPAEVVSVGVFAKTFDHPIEKVIVGTTGAPALSFVNANGANNYGLELEVRKNLAALAPALTPLTLFANTTVMHSRIEPGNAGLSSNTNAKRPMQGQAGYVVNAGLSFIDPSGRVSATGLYNVVGRRIVEVGQLPVPDAYELPRNLVDFSAQAQLSPQLALKLDAKNLLDAPYRVVQGSVTRLRYRAGRVLTLGATLTL
jgi:TonB-dependent receptor